MAIMEVVLAQTYLNQRINNIFHYQGAGTPAALTMSAALFRAIGALETAGAYPDTGLMCKIAACQAVGVSFDSIAIRDVYSNTDFYESPFIAPLTGAVAGTNEGLPAFSALGFRSSRVRSDIRRGTKRFTGLTEAGQTNGAISGGLLSTTAPALAVALGAVLTINDDGNILTFSPIVVSKRKCGSWLPDCAPNAYYWWETEAEQEDHIAVGITYDVYPNVRSQVSRQIGRGA